jgi:hypothetical protein
VKFDDIVMFLILLPVTLLEAVLVPVVPEFPAVSVEFEPPVDEDEEEDEDEDEDDFLEDFDPLLEDLELESELFPVSSSIHDPSQ